ncbi:hypothetical protein LPJ61_006101, partial [Coemansia biformis]
AEYTDGTGKVETFVVVSPAVSNSSSLVSALETIQTDFNARLTSLIDAERTAVGDETTQCKRQKSE